MNLDYILRRGGVKELWSKRLRQSEFNHKQGRPIWPALRLEPEQIYDNRPLTWRITMTTLPWIWTIEGSSM
jgi:hypothetical protein